MEQEIIEVPYNDSNVTPQVITIDLPHPQATTIQLYPQDGDSLTPLQTSKSAVTHALEQNNRSPSTDFDGAEQKYEATRDNMTIEADENDTSNGSRSSTRFKWTKEKSQVAMNLVKHGCKPKLVSVAVGCSLRTAQKFVETVTPKMEGESFRTYEIRRRGRKSKDVNERLDAIREVLSRDSSKTQVEIAADLKVSNTTVCRDLKRIGASWKEKNNAEQDGGKRGDTRRDRQSTGHNRRSNTSTGSAAGTTTTSPANNSVATTPLASETAPSPGTNKGRSRVRQKKSTKKEVDSQQ